MNIRAMQKSDMIDLKMIHHKYYRDEFNFPNFEDKFLNAFVVEHEDDIVTAGGLRLITEAIGLTNKGLSKKVKLEGLKLLLEACAFTAHNEKFNEFVVFIQDPNWEEVMLKRGFNKTKGESLVFGFEVNNNAQR